MSDYLAGSDLFGTDYGGGAAAAAMSPFPGMSAIPAGAGAATAGAVDQQIIAIRVKNIPEIVAKQGGSAGALAMSLIPGTVTSKFYSEFVKKMKEKFVTEGVDADVQVVSTVPGAPRSRNDLVVGAAVGVGAAGAGYGLYKLIKYFWRA